MAPQTFRTLTILFGLLVIGLACGLYEAETGPGSLTVVPQKADQEGGAGQPADEGFLGVYFTDPDPKKNRGGPDAVLAAAIDNARVSVDAAIYDLNLWSIRDALIAAHKRGVVVRVVYENDNQGREIDELIQAGVPSKPDRNPSLMHDKFVIIDQFEVWTGSMNLTINGAYRNNNNLVWVRDAEAAAAYTAEFNEMYIDTRYGERSPSGSGAAVSFGMVYFSPDDQVGDQMAALISSAESNIVFLAFSFTADPLADALIAAAGKGVIVQGVMDEEQALNNTGGDYNRLLDAGIDVLLDGNPEKMHHKVLIIDNRTVVTGSYNFSRSAETRNDENVLFIQDSKIVTAFLDEFARVYSDAQEK